jgi:hypothetical protein
MSPDSPNYEFKAKRYESSNNYGSTMLTSLKITPKPTILDIYAKSPEQQYIKDKYQSFGER